MELKEKGDDAQVGAFDQLKVALIWSSNVDLDLMAFYRSEDGQTGGVYSPNYSGGDLGSLNDFPYIQLSGDEGVDGGGRGEQREEMRIAGFDELEELYVCAVNYTDALEGNASSFSDYDAHVEVETDQGDRYDIPLDSRDQGAVAVLAKLESGFMGPEIVNQSEVETFEAFQQSIPGAEEVSAEGSSSIDPKIQQEAPELELHAKKAQDAVENADLAFDKAKVGLCLDISGSMQNLYQSGQIQEFAERVLAMGTRFDDDDAIDVFLFGREAYNIGEMKLGNFRGFVQEQLRNYDLESATNYAEGIKAIREHYVGNSLHASGDDGDSGWFGGGGGDDDSKWRRHHPASAPLPIYIMFLTDGAASDKRRAERQITWASYEPIFWQFMAIDDTGTLNFDFLEGLDELEGRYVDNASFFQTEGPNALSDDELYGRMMEEYPQWLRRRVEQMRVFQPTNE